MILVFLASLSTASAEIEQHPGRPELMPPQRGCSSWVGMATGGNDPSVRIQLNLCPKGDKVAGELQFSSLESGWNLREVEGEWDATHQKLRLSDIRVLEEEPNPGWRFCTVDAYTLSRSGASLKGDYVSDSCNDRAELELIRMDEEEPEDTPEVAAPPPPVAVEGCASGCKGCHVGETRTRASYGFGWLLFALAFGRRFRPRF